MRGFFEHRVAEFRRSDKGAVETFWLNAPLDKYELAAAKAQGCAGCVWWTHIEDPDAHESETDGQCHHIGMQAFHVTGPGFWCSEWRGEPSKETP